MRIVGGNFANCDDFHLRESLWEKETECLNTARGWKTGFCVILSKIGESWLLIYSRPASSLNTSTRLKSRHILTKSNWGHRSRCLWCNMTRGSEDDTPKLNLDK